jgi:hypothetical protein
LDFDLKISDALEIASIRGWTTALRFQHQRVLEAFRRSMSASKSDML